MKILYLITGLGGGGAEKVVADLADQMFQRGHQVKIAYLKGEVVVQPENNEIELVYLGLESLQQSISAYKKYKNLLDQFEPDVVHAHMVHANIFARISRKFRPIVKLICTAHNSNEGGKLRMLAYRLTNDLSDLNTNVSKEATKAFLAMQAFDPSAITIYNGIDINKFDRTKVDKNYLINGCNYSSLKVILAVGRFNQQKDYPNLLNAIQLLKTQTSQKFKVLIAGDGEERNKLESMIRELDLEKDIVLLGRRDDIPQLMVKANVFVLPSAYEGFGLVVAEAMACETFVVATDCGGVKEVMGDTGILVQPKNSLDLAQALMRALNLPDIEVIQNNMKAVKHIRKNFDLQNIVTKWLELYAN